MTSSPSQHVLPLTALRGFAALWVASLHLCASPLRGTFLYPFFVSGGQGVSIFFVLSGFILSYTYMDKFNTGTLRNSSKEFILNRVARIYPLHLFCLVYVYIFNLYYFPLYTNGEIFFYNVFLIHAWGIFGVSDISYNASSWSVSVEWFWYLCFPLIIKFVKKRKKYEIIILLFLVTLLLFYRVDAGFFYYFQSILKFICWGHPDGQFYCGKAVGSQGMNFCAGILLYPLVKDFSNTRIWDYLGIFSFLFLIFFFLVPEEARSGWWSSLYGLLSILYLAIIASLYKSNGWCKKIFENSFAVYLGEISFSLYLVHLWILISFRAFWPQYGSIIALFSLPLSLCVSMCIYHLLEVPSRRFLRAFFKNTLYPVRPVKKVEALEYATN